MSHVVETGRHHVVLARSVRPAFNAAARGLGPTKPPITRPPPRPKPPFASPAPRPRGLNSFNRNTGAGPVTRVPGFPRTVKRRTAVDIARAGNHAQARAGLRQSFRSQARRGTLRPTFERMARPPFRPMVSSARTVRRPPTMATPRPTIRPPFQRAVWKSKAASAFRKASTYPGAKGPVTWRMTRPGEVFYRSYYGTKSAQSGRYASPIRPANLRQARGRNALPPWNPGYKVSRFVGTGRELVGVSRVAPGFGRSGGGVQAYFPRMPRFRPSGWNRGALTEIFDTRR